MGKREGRTDGQIAASFNAPYTFDGRGAIKQATKHIAIVLAFRCIFRQFGF